MNKEKISKAGCSQSAVKSIAAFILSFVMLFTLSAGMDLSVFAADYVPHKSGDFTYIVTDDRKTAVISEYTGNAAKVSVPDTLDGYKIVIIGPDAFAGNQNIEMVELPGSITDIRARAFRNCTNLKRVAMGNSVEDISFNAFENCINLTKISLSENLTVIRNYVFNNCKSLTDIVLPKNLKSITDNAFFGCTSLKSISVPKSLSDVAWCAFDECVNLEDVYYGGTEDEWSSVVIDSSNTYLLNAKIHCNGVVQEVFSDLTGLDAYNNFVAYTSLYNKFITGTNPPANNSFSPTASITRAMFVTILYRMAGSPYDNGRNPYGEKTPFTDITNTSVYYYNAACWALDEGVTDQILFKPNDNVTREQTATMLFRYAEENNMLGDSAYKNTNLNGYYDYAVIHTWAAEPMQWANYNGMITGTVQGYANPQGATQRIHATKILYGFGVVCNIGNFE